MGNMQSVLITKTDGKGKGVFAAKNFSKGKEILEMKGQVLTGDEIVKLSNYHNNHCTPIGLDKYMLFGSPEKFINHSCSPNVFDYNGRVFAMRNIKKGDELAFDYSINSTDDWVMKCSCKNKDCRKIVRGNFFKLPREVQIKYLPYVDEWFKKEFKKEISKLKNI